MPTEKIRAPAPDAYSPLTMIGFNISSRMPKVPSFKIGNDRTNTLDFEYKIKQAREVPGPGTYSRFSEFQTDSQ